MSEYIVETFGIVQDFANLHGDMNTPLYQAIMNVMVSRQREQIVRCCDCAHYADHEWITSPLYGLGSDFEHVCHFWHGKPTKVEPNGFCAWGEPNKEAAR